MLPRRRAASNPGSNDGQSNPATLAAAMAFLQHRESQSSLSAAAAATALRTHATTPISVADVQTKRTLRRASSNASNGSGTSLTRRGITPSLTRKTSSGSISASMSERTFREAGPPPGPKYLPSSNVPHPGYYTNKSLPHLPRDVESDGDDRSRTYSLGSKPKNRGMAAAQVAMRASSSVDLTTPPPAPLVRQYTAPAPNHVPGLRPSEVDRIQYSLERIANQPVKRKQIQGPALKVGPLADRHAGGRAAGTAVDKINATKRGVGLTQAEEESSESAAAVALQHSYALPKRKPLPSGLTDSEERSSESAAAAALHHALPPRSDLQPKRSTAGLVQKPQQPIVEPEHRSAAPAPAKKIAPAPVSAVASTERRKPRDTSPLRSDDGSQAREGRPQFRKGSLQNDNVSGLGIASNVPVSKDFGAPPVASQPSPRQIQAIQPDSNHGRNNSISTASDRSQQLHPIPVAGGVSRADSISPTRRAHFPSGTVVTSDESGKHNPQPRALSPVKSALKHSRQGSTSPMAATFAEGLPLAPGKLPSESDTTSLLSDEDRTASLTRRKKANRVSFDDEATVLRAQSPPTSPESVSPSPDNRSKTKKWLGIAKGRRPSEDSADEDIPDIKPTPALPSFKSVHTERHDEHDSREPIPPVVTSIDRMEDSSESEPDYSQSTTQTSDPNSKQTIQVPEIAVVAATPTPKEEKASYMEAKDLQPAPEATSSEPEFEDTYERDVRQSPQFEVIEEESEDSSIYSDAEETLTDVEGFGSIDAMLEDKPQRSAASKGKSPVAEPAQSVADWTPHQEYWRGLSEQQRLRLEQQAAVMAAENKAARENVAAAKKSKPKAKSKVTTQQLPAATVPESKQVEKSSPVITTVKHTEQTVPPAQRLISEQRSRQPEKTAFSRTSMRQPAVTKSQTPPSASAQTASDKSALGHTMRKSMRHEPSQDTKREVQPVSSATRSSFRTSMRQEPQQEMQRDALPASGGALRGTLRTSMRGPRPNSVTSMPEVVRPRTPPQSQRRISSQSGMSPVKESPATPPARKTIQKKILRGSPSPMSSPAESYGSGGYFGITAPSSRKKSDRLGRMRRRLSDGYDSDDSASSFRRTRIAKPGSAFASMTMRGRQTEAPKSPNETGRLGSLSLRSRSPSVRSEASKDGFFSKNTLRTWSLSKSSKEKNKKSSIIPTFGKSKAAGSKSRIVDSSDEDTESVQPTYKSRFAEESDSEVEAFSPVRGIPKKREDDRDSTSLSDSSGVDSKAASPLPPKIIETPALAGPVIAPVSTAQSEETVTDATSPVGEIPTPTPTPGFLSRQKKNLRDARSSRFLSKKKKRDDPTRIKKAEVESAARRDTPLERSTAEIQLHRRGSGRLVVEEAESDSDSDDEFVDAGSAIELPTGLEEAPIDEVKHAGTDAQLSKTEPEAPEPKMIRPSTSDGTPLQTPTSQVEKRLTLPTEAFSILQNNATTPTDQIGTPTSERRPNLLRKTSKDHKKNDAASPTEKKKFKFLRRVFKRSNSSSNTGEREEGSLVHAMATVDTRSRF